MDCKDLEGILTRILLTPLYKKRYNKKDEQNPERVIRKNIVYLRDNGFIEEIDYNILMKKYSFNINPEDIQEAIKEYFQNKKE